MISTVFHKRIRDRLLINILKSPIEVLKAWRLLRVVIIAARKGIKWTFMKSNIPFFVFQLFIFTLLLGEKVY